MNSFSESMSVHNVSAVPTEARRRLDFEISVSHHVELGIETRSSSLKACALNC